MASLSLSLSVKQDGFTSTRERFEQFPDKLDRAMQTATLKAANIVEEAYKQTIPRKTGRTAGTIHSVVEPKPNGATAYIGTDDEVAGYLEYGTKRHFVKPREKKALHWMEGSQSRFSKGHWVSGIQAHNSLLKASQASQSLIERAYADEVGEVFR